MKKVAETAVFLIFLFLPVLHGAQEKPKIHLSLLVAEGFGEEEVRSLEYLLYSYLRDMGNIAGPEERENESEDAYTLTGRLRMDGNSRFLDIEITKGSGKRFVSTYSFRNSGELVLNVRSMLFSAFQNSPFPGEARAEQLSPAVISGTWRNGGGGLVSVRMARLERDGTGTIVFSSGAAMKIVYAVEDNILIITQNSPNNERFYHPLPLRVARELAEKAEPMRWELLLFEDGMVLRGITVFTGAVYDDGSLVELIPGKMDAVEWQKSR